MPNFATSLAALKSGGVFVYPLFALMLLSIAVIVDRAWVYWRYARPPRVLQELLGRSAFDWDEFERRLAAPGRPSYFAEFCRTILEHRSEPLWWVESVAADEASVIERRLRRGLWILDTIVTAAPLLGLLGTISGMIGAFHLFGSGGLVDPGAVTGGVAEALVATAIGISIAVVCLLAFNFFSRTEAAEMDEMERLGTRLIDRIRRVAEAGEGGVTEAPPPATLRRVPAR
jgi:biopolymer transport protein ExbB